ncbi:MAG: RibD family protein [Actinomycetota bacterium]|nr:RibD family protein [Actinomycetota bacterium]
MLPRIIIHNQVSVDGRFDWIVPDLALFYGIAASLGEDATLAGSNTVLAGYPDEATWLSLDAEYEPTRREPDSSLPLLAVPDSRGRIRVWHLLRQEQYWRDAVALVSSSTPRDYLDYLERLRVDYIVAGDDHVDMRAALEELNARYGVKVVRADCGGTLNGVLLREGLVDEVSLLISPSLVGGTKVRSIFIAPELEAARGVIDLSLRRMERLEGDVVWLLYQVKQASRRGQ